MPKVSELIDHLKKHYDPDQAIAYSLWSKEDVEYIAERKKELEEDDSIELNLFDNQIEDILNDFHENHDAEYGLTWIGLECFFDDVLREGKGA